MKIPLNSPFLPPKKVFDRYTDEIWQRNWLTNHGPLVQEFEKKVSEFLGLSDFIFLNNGTTCLLVALKALDIEGEVITTPYSYVATTSSLVWQNCRPVFADIDENKLTINPEKIEESITDETTAILATHIYGTPCPVEAIQEIAKKNNLKVIYDAAHCFGVTYKGESILKWGDISIVSFHATKLLHTVEGGGFFSTNNNIMDKARFLMNFGHDGLYDYKSVGINGKNSEIHAAMGLCNLSYAAEILEKRERQVKQYKAQLDAEPVTFQIVEKNTKANYAYFPIIFKTSDATSKVAEHLTDVGVETRRYFKPSLNKLSYLEKGKRMPVAEDISDRILCLPLFHDLTSEEITFISAEVAVALKKE